MRTKEQAARYQREWNKKNPEKSKRIKRNAAYKRNYGISLEEYETMLESQGGVCAVCGGEPYEQRVMHVDHDHDTGEVRGILHGACNAMLGSAGDSADRLLAGAAYLMRNEIR